MDAALFQQLNRIYAPLRGRAVRLTRLLAEFQLSREAALAFDWGQLPQDAEVYGVEQYPMEYLKELYRANDLIVMGIPDADVEMAMDILYDAVNTMKKTIRVNREDKPSEVVRSRLLKLQCMDIMYAIEQYHKQTTEIRYQKAYMLSILYDARGQGHLDYSNQVQHDLYGYGGGGG